MTAGDFIERVRARGGALRLLGEHVQYRPSGVLTEDELAWLRGHRDEVARALVGTVPSEQQPASALPAGSPLGEAGPGIKAWHCSVAITSVHRQGERADGSSHCATCHPPTPGRAQRP